MTFIDMIKTNFCWIPILRNRKLYMPYACIWFFLETTHTMSPSQFNENSPWHLYIPIIMSNFQISVICIDIRMFTRSILMFAWCCLTYTCNILLIFEPLMWGVVQEARDDNVAILLRFRTVPSAPSSTGMTFVNGHSLFILYKIRYHVHVSSA